MIRYSNQGAIRNQPLSDRMMGALSFLPELGVEMEVFSGGQAAKGSGGPRTGSTRHDHGNAADVFFYKDGRRLDWADPNDQPIFSEIVRRGKAAGLTGFGAGQNYMQPGSMHIGFGTPAVWGAGGKGSNAANWLRHAYHGTAGPQPSNATGGIMNQTISTRGQASQQSAQSRPQGLLGMLGGGSSQPDRSEALDRIAMGLMSMSAYPTAGMRAQMGSIQDRMQDRRDTKRDATQRNKTADWLESQGMGPLAEGVRAGAITAPQAFSYARQQPERDKGVEINGRLVNPYTGEVMGDYSGGGSAAEETIGRIMEVRNPQTGQPFTRQEAIQIAELYTVSRHPQTGEAQLINKATGRPVGAPEQPETSDDVTVPALEPKSPQNVGDVPSALGAQGIGKTFVNRVGDFFGAGLAFPEAEEARSELNNLSTQTMLTLSGEWSGRPSNLTRERIEALTVKPNEFFTGKDSALIKLQDMRDLIGEAMISADRVERGQFSPTQKTEARQKQRALGQLYRAYSAIISNLEGGSGSGTTSGGIKWSIEQ
ncbi:hypothetical protein PVV74_13785 [Roseovarius sp. SK2]|uniref:hypothetical protein n=1 Tax=Roseovarius TaxID=74030 RepID=UPI00237B2DA1|nr:hypothetical protein [Roseovarius sp. SK2]MDD9726536.1 hypothetical protein [Roseovarius sp. SK2]